MASELIEKFKTKMGKNIMTPHVLGYKVKDDTVIELSSGRGMNNEPIYGVTVRTLSSLGKWTETGLSKMLYSLAEAKAYAKKVKEVV
jgi:hypothetical protein